MKLIHDIRGRWAWEDNGRLSLRQLEFVEGGSGIRLIVYEGDTRFSLESLALNTEKEPDGSMSYFLGNYWPNRDGTGFFSFESRFSESREGSTFINASEFTFQDADTLKQVFMGFRFDRDGEKWLPFNETMVLKRFR